MKIFSVIPTGFFKAALLSGFFLFIICSGFALAEGQRPSGKGKAVPVAETGAADLAAVPWSPGWSSRTGASVLPGGIFLAGTPEPCLSRNEGVMRYAREYKALIICDGVAWKAIPTIPLDPPPEKEAAP